MTGPAGCLKVLQVHPTRTCNLRCAHCYSASGPEARGSLPLDLLRRALDGARAEGFNVLGCSGGEPLLYYALPELLAHAKALGMATTVTTNGMLLDEARLGRLLGLADALAISLDGIPESHDRLRRHIGAFGAMKANLPRLRAAGLPFGFIFTLTRHNLHELEWVARFAEAEGARLLQVHPLEPAGRARRELDGAEPDDWEAAVAYLEAARIQRRMEGRLRVQLDLLDRDALRSDPARAFAEDDPPAPDAPLADLVAPLILEADGTLVPIQYGFPRAFALGSLQEASLPALAAQWRAEVHGPFRALCREVHREAVAGTGLPFLNWYELLADRARAWQPAGASA